MPIEVALTFDDLPGVNLAAISHIITTLDNYQIQGVYGFTNGLTSQLDPAYRNILNEWIHAGHFLANHTYSHLNLSEVMALDYINDIERNMVLLTEFPHQDKKYFRYPFLDEGDSQQKRLAVREYLFSQQYQIVPATIYIEEYRWNNTFTHCILYNDQAGLKLLKNNLIKHALESLDLACGYAKLLFDRNIKHILLLHETLFNAYLLADILSALRQAGVKFISLNEALSDEIYQLNPGVLGNENYGFLGQLCAARHIKLTKKLQEKTANFIQRYSEKYCSFSA